jgi:SAM-dependent methyltransferase
LALLERHHDPDTIAALERTGVGAGWRCLDVGAGSGSIARWLQARGAEVLATDLDTSRLDGVPARVHDITSDDPLPDPFDLVHTRLVLLHLPQRAEVARRLVALSRGWVVVGDIDFTPVTMREPTAAWKEAWQAWCAVTVAAGWDLGCGRRLAALLEEAGLRQVDAAASGREAEGGSPALEILSLAFERLRPRLEAHGADVDVARELLMDPARAFVPPTTWTAWGQTGHS